jgi:uncharacterized membrane protein
MNRKFNLIILVLLGITIFCVMTSNAVNAVVSNSSTNKIDNLKSENDVKKPVNKKKSQYQFLIQF